MTTTTDTKLGIQVLQENLARGVAMVLRATEGRIKGTLPILSNVLVATEYGRLKLAATDLDNSIVVHVGAKVDSEGAYTVEARALSDFVRRLPSATVAMAHDPVRKTVAFECARTKAHFPTMDAEDYPRIPHWEESAVELMLPIPALRHALSMVEPAIATDDSRPVLTAMQWAFSGETLTLAGADGFRLATYHLPCAPVGDAAYLVGRKTIALLRNLTDKKTGEVRVRVNKTGQQIEFSLEDVVLTGQLIQGTFPNFQQLIPTEHLTRCTVAVDALKNALAVAGVASGDSGIVRLETRKAAGVLRVFATMQDPPTEVETLVDATVEGDDGKIALAPRYLDAFIQTLTGDAVIDLQGSASQMVIRQAELPAFTGVVMPLFVQW